MMKREDKDMVCKVLNETELIKRINELLPEFGIEGHQIKKINFKPVTGLVCGPKEELRYVELPNGDFVEKCVKVGF